ncbi:hypothetical protein D3C78_549260 [compost metagenome]
MTYGRLTTAEIVLAYELRAEGIDWQHIASGLGVDPDYLRQRIRQAEINGLSAPRLPQ